MTQNNFKVAITGGIGSGKSAVAEIVRRRNYAVFSCDEIYSELLESREFTKKIIAEFGGVLNSDGTVNRKMLSEIVFSDKAALNKLNSITHPAIIEEVLKRSSGHKVSFTEVPLLFENGFETLFDGVIVVLRDIEERIDSVAIRDNIDRKSVILRIKSQFNYENSDFTKYYVIHNNGNIGDLEQQTVEILEKINKRR